MKGGLNISDLATDPAGLEDSDQLHSFAIGAWYGLPLNPSFTFQPEMYYSVKGDGALLSLRLGMSADGHLGEIGLNKLRLHLAGERYIGQMLYLALLRNLGAKTVVIAGVSTNVAIPNATLDCVNFGFNVVIPRDAITGYPVDYTDVIIKNTLSLVAKITTTDELVALWS